MELQFQIEWDERKNKANIRKHGFDFADAEEMFRGILLAAPDTREDYREDRWIGIGPIGGRVAVVAFVENDFDRVRIISLRKANSYETRRYAKVLKNQLEKD